MESKRDKEMVELLDKCLAPLDPVVHRDYLYNVITYHCNSNKTMKEVLQDEIKAMDGMDNKEDTMAKVGTKISLDDMLDHIYEALGGVKEEYLTEIYNNICFDKVKQIDDDTWEVIENQD